MAEVGGFAVPEGLGGVEEVEAVGEDDPAGHLIGEFRDHPGPERAKEQSPGRRPGVGLIVIDRGLTGRKNRSN